MVKWSHLLQHHLRHWHCAWKSIKAVFLRLVDKNWRMENKQRTVYLFKKPVEPVNGCQCLILGSDWRLNMTQYHCIKLNDAQLYCV